MDAILFDVDGTLWDSTEKVAIAWRKVCRNAGVPEGHITGPRLKREFGKLLADIGRSLFPDMPEEEALSLTAECCRYENEYLKEDKPELYPGVFHVFETLYGRIPLFIVSNCQEGYIETLLEVSGLTPYVTDHLCPGDTGQAKAANIRTIVEKYGCREPVYVGDTLGDQTACREAGVPFCFAAYGFGTVTDPDFIIRSPEELLTQIPLCS